MYLHSAKSQQTLLCCSLSVSSVAYLSLSLSCVSCSAMPIHMSLTLDGQRLISDELLLLVIQQYMWTLSAETWWVGVYERVNAGAVLAQEKVRRQFAQWSRDECWCAVIPALPLHFSLWAGTASGFASLLIAFPLGGSMQRNFCDGFLCPIRVITRLSTRPEDYGEAKLLVWGLNWILRFSPGVPSLNLLFLSHSNEPTDSDTALSVGLLSVTK